MYKNYKEQSEKSHKVTPLGLQACIFLFSTLMEDVLVKWLINSNQQLTCFPGIGLLRLCVHNIPGAIWSQVICTEIKRNSTESKLKWNALLLSLSLTHARARTHRHTHKCCSTLMMNYFELVVLLSFYITEIMNVETSD